MRLYVHIRRADMADGGVRVQASIWTPDADDDERAIRLSKLGRVIPIGAPSEQAEDIEAQLRSACRTLCIEEREMPGIAGQLAVIQ